MDQAELFKDWAKEKATNIFSSAVINEGEEALVNFYKTIVNEVDAGAMETKRDLSAGSGLENKWN